MSVWISKMYFNIWNASQCLEYGLKVLISKCGWDLSCIKTVLWTLNGILFTWRKTNVVIFCQFLWSTIFALKFSLVALITSNYFDFLITVHQYFILQIYLWNIVKKFTGNLMFLCIFQLCKTQYFQVLHIFWVCVSIECKI